MPFKKGQNELKIYKGMADEEYQKVCRDIFDSVSNKQEILEMKSFKPFMINIAKATGEDPHVM